MTTPAGTADPAAPVPGQQPREGVGIDAAAVDTAVALARRWAAATDTESSAHSARLAALVADPAGLDLAVRFIDRVVRPEDVAVAALELGRLRASAVPRGVLGPVDRALFGLGTRLGPAFPAVVVPAARARLRGLVGHLVADLDRLGPHIEALRSQGFRLNLNLLGEAVLGETEATARLMRIQTLAARRDVDHVSVKVSGLASQLSPWDPTALDRLLMRLRLLARSAAWDGTMLTLDMEEYRDLDLTVQVFTALLAEPELSQAGLGIAVQAYLPDALDVLNTITEHAIRRVASGGAPARVRLVKGANLPMERVEGTLHGWHQAPYSTKAEVDANFVRLLDRALTPERARALRVGAASHNLFHVALAHVMATDRGLVDTLDIEMLQGMAPAQAAAVRDDVGRVLLYTPVVARGDFDLAVAYLVRRLEETAAQDNFLPALLAGGQTALETQERAFRESVAGRHVPSTRPHRRLRPEPADAAPSWRNEPDTDPAGAGAQEWAAQVLTRTVAAPLQTVGTRDDVDAVVAKAVAAGPGWSATSPAERARVLRSVAGHLRVRREDLLAVMAQEGAKTIAEADPEVSEAVDFATYYAERAEDLADGAVPGARFRSWGITVVTPPWNFPVAIPLGSVLAALAAGSPVILKPAPQTPLCAAVAMTAVHAAFDDAGVPRDVAQVVDPIEGSLGRHLVSHPGVQRVLLTGSIETARTFAGWRPELEVIAETSGKNAIVVTPSADIDLAVADVVRSAFGHSGQKCSAASLLILVGSAGRSGRLRRQLADAVGSLRVGEATDLATTMGPLIEPPSGKLLRALTTLDDGEDWLVPPERLGARLWTPGVKHGVAPGSFFHLTECFGPVLGIMRVNTLQEAIDLQNAVPFGLTGGLHSLDAGEIAAWLDQVQVGNAYVNRHITGAVVGRQPFGGWKASTVGPGAKAGGPNYVAQLGAWSDGPEVPQDDAGWLAWARADDERAWTTLFGVEHDLAALDIEANVLRYLPVEHLTIVVGHRARDREVERVRAAAQRAGVPVTVRDVAEVLAATRAGRLSGRVRVVGGAPALRPAVRADGGVDTVTVLDHPVLASGQREMLTVLREQTVTRTRHRFGHPHI